MDRLSKSHHIRVILKKGFNENLITQLRNEAIEYLRPVVEKVPRSMSDEIKAAYREKGISTAWNLTSTDAYEFYFMSRDADLSESQKNAAALLYACTEALENSSLPDRVRQNIIDTYAGLDSDLVEKAKKFPPGRQQGAQIDSTKHIFDIAKNNRSMSAKELFNIADKSIIEDMALGTFQNHVRDARKVYPKIKAQKASG